MVHQSPRVSSNTFRIGALDIFLKWIPIRFRISARRVQRLISDALARPPFALDRVPSAGPLFSHLIYEYRSAILKNWEGANRRLQAGKQTNIALAAPFFDGTVIRPGQIFSFYRRLGFPTEKRGFCLGYEVNGHGLGEGIGGGLCQLASACLWVMLHAGFDVLERHHHDFDLFPDENRRVPFGTGASVFFNYRDLRLQCKSDRSAWLSVKAIENELRVGLWSDGPWPFNMRVEERGHRFEKDPSGTVYRSNDIYRIQKGGDGEFETLLWKNRARVLYPIPL